MQQPGRPEDLNITEMRFYSDTLESPIRFILESFTLLGGEEGRWTLTIAHRDYGPPDYDLEYYEDGYPKLPDCLKRPLLYDRQSRVQLSRSATQNCHCDAVWSCALQQARFEHESA